MNGPWRRCPWRRMIACALAFPCVAPSYAVNASAFISGTVTNHGKPAAHVAVTASGNNLTVNATTDAQGHFSFPPLALGHVRRRGAERRLAWPRARRPRKRRRKHTYRA